MVTASTAVINTAPTKHVTVALAEDHVLVRQALRTLLERFFTVLGEAADGQEALLLAQRVEPDVFIMDIMMPNSNGFEALTQISRYVPRTQLLVLSMHSDVGYAAQAVANGARGFVLKQNSSEDLIVAINALYNGDRFFSKPFSEAAIWAHLDQTQSMPRDLFDTLTNREREVLQLVAEGSTSVQAGEHLSISPRTIEIHRRNLMRKLNLSTHSDIVRYAIRHRLIAAE